MAHAEEPAPPKQEGKSEKEVPVTNVTVTGKKEAQAVPSALTSPTLEQARAELARTPGGASVVDLERVKEGRASTMPDVFKYTPGVIAASRFGAEEARISIRGSGIQRTFHGRGLKLMQDGIPLNLADGGFDMQAVEPLAAKYVEVQRGANALQYGGTTLGGSVNFVTPTGYDASKAQARMEYGSFGYLRSQVSSGMVIGPADYYVSLTR
ncbi:MAG: TonB-dependent receptor plug domain-containing protein, partial [Planctomycetota bacterium]|nr:TonB-dependent receptor plug domain-containing protein [Planctomycetota bacterium]